MLRSASSIGCFLVVSRIARPASAVGGITFNAAPPSIVPILTVVSPKNSSFGKFCMTDVVENVEQFFDRRIAFFGIRRVGGLSLRADRQSKCSLRTDRQIIVGRLAVDHVFAFRRERMQICRLCPGRRALLPRRYKASRCRRFPLSLAVPPP